MSLARSYFFKFEAKLNKNDKLEYRFRVVIDNDWMCATDIYVYGYRLTHSEDIKLSKHRYQISKKCQENIRL